MELLCEKLAAGDEYLVLSSPLPLEPILQPLLVEGALELPPETDKRRRLRSRRQHAAHQLEQRMTLGGEVLAASSFFDDVVAERAAIVEGPVGPGPLIALILHIVRVGAHPLADGHPLRLL